MSEANDIGPTSPDVGSNALLDGREADGRQRIGEAAPTLAGPAEGGSEQPSCATCSLNYVLEGIFACAMCDDFSLWHERMSASGPASTGVQATAHRGQG